MHVDMSTSLTHHPKMAKRAPAQSTLPSVAPPGRALQLRLAKRAQRERDRQDGLVLAQLKLPTQLAEKLAFARRQPDFKDRLGAFLNLEVIEVARFPQLRLLCWNRHDRFISARDALSLYERNWRFVEADKLEAAERALLNRLDLAYGGGVMHV